MVAEPIALSTCYHFAGNIRLEPQYTAELLASPLAVRINAKGNYVVGGVVPGVSVA